MLRLATVCLRGRAIRWHAELDVETRRDWDAFVRAMFRDFRPDVRDENESGVSIDELDVSDLSV